MKATGKDLPVEQPTEVIGKDGKKRKAKADKQGKKPKQITSEADMNANTAKAIELAKTWNYHHRRGSG